VGFLAILLVAALGGLALNFTPCVLPVLPIKVMALSAAAGSCHRMLALGLAHATGIVAFWLALGVTIAFVSGVVPISSLFQSGWFAPLIGLVLALMGVAMVAGISVRLPSTLHGVGFRGDTIHGSFLLGILTGVLATPCTAPFMGGVSAWAVTQPPAGALAAFVCIGGGMALPYVVLSARPGLLRRIPRSGPATLAVRQALGLLLMAVSAYFLGVSVAGALRRPPAPATGAYWWVVAGFVIVAGSWVSYRTFRITRSAIARLSVPLGALVAIAGALWSAQAFTRPAPIAWDTYTSTRFAESITQRMVVVVDFTAEWCLNCKVLETVVLNRPPVSRLLAAPDLIPLQVDLTRENPEGRAKLAELGQVGIPLLAIYGPALDEPLLYDAYTPGVVVSAIARARGRDSKGR
jgi:thiol:disulfide interchange protein DsbD